MLSAVNVLENSLKIWLREMFSNLICLSLMENLDKSAAVQISSVFGTREHIDSWKSLWNRSFGGIQQTTFFGVNNFQSI